jgi:uncharacterized protein (DUF488 family)
MNQEQRPRQLFSIGHSNHPLEKLLALLQRYQIDVVVDTRSHPRSRIAPQFDSRSLKTALRNAGVKYLYLGKELGGRPEGSEFYDAEGHVLYDRLAASPSFQSGLERLKRGALSYRVAVLCSEESPEHCHRRLLIGRVLVTHGFVLHHIRGDGRLQTEAELAQAEPAHEQGSLFSGSQEGTWKSTRSVSQRRQLLSSSER